MSSNLQPDPVWTEWRRVTRFLKSTRIAFARERSLWASLELSTIEGVELSTPHGLSEYKISLRDHLSTVTDEQTLYGAVLIESFALAEAAAARKLGVESREFCGIEDWAERLLTANSRTWDDVLDGRVGAVEVAVVRNAFAHGTRLIDERSSRRLRDAGCAGREPGSAVTLDYEQVCVFRDRLRSLLRVGNINQPTRAGDDG